MVIAVTFTLGGVYVVYFRHPPAKDILQNQGAGSHRDFGESFYKKSSGGQGTEKDETFGTEYWDVFLKKNNFVAIGAVYTKCGECDEASFFYTSNGRDSNKNFYNYRTYFKE